MVTVIIGAVGTGCYLAADLRYRRRDFRGLLKSPLRMLDLAATCITMGVASVLVGELYPAVVSQGVIPLRSPLTVGILICIAILTVAWTETKRQLQFQRPRGLVFAECLLLAAVGGFIEIVTFRDITGGSVVPSIALSSLAAVCGLGLLLAIVPPFVNKYEGLRILERVAEEEQLAQPECTPPTPECPQPGLWKMLDSQTTELEVLDFLKALIITLKPGLVVETGTFLGHGTAKLAEGIKENGFGRVITIEADPAIFKRAKQRIEDLGLAPWVEMRLESSLDTKIDGMIDFLYSDSHLKNRENEIRRFLPHLNPQGLLAIHDASSHFGIVREAALRLEKEGLLSVLLLSTPRGVVLAQRRQDRK